MVLLILACIKYCKMSLNFFNLDIHNIMSGRGHTGRSRTSAPKAPLERDVEHTLRSEDASMHQPPVEPSRATDPGGSTLMMD